MTDYYYNGYELLDQYFPPYWAYFHIDVTNSDFVGYPAQWVIYGNQTTHPLSVSPWINCSLIFLLPTITCFFSVASKMLPNTIIEFSFITLAEENYLAIPCVIKTLPKPNITLFSLNYMSPSFYRPVMIR